MRKSHGATVLDVSCALDCDPFSFGSSSSFERGGVRWPCKGSDIKINILSCKLYSIEKENILWMLRS